jgi:hypothetical protein
LGHGAMRPSGHRGIGTAVVNLCVALPCALLGPSRQVFFDRSTSVHTAPHRRVCEGRQEGLQSLLIRECGGSTTAGQPETVYEEVWQQRGSWVHAFAASPHHHITAARIGRPSTLCSALLCARAVPALCPLCVCCSCCANAGIRLPSGLQDQPRVIWPRVGRKIQRSSAENPRLPALEHQNLNFTGLSAIRRHPKPSTLTATSPIPSQWPVPRRLPKRSPRREQRFQSTSTALCAPAIR